MAYRLSGPLNYDPFEDEDDSTIDSPTEPELPEEFSLSGPLDYDPFEGEDPYVNDPQSSDLDEPDENGHSLWDIPRMMGKGSAGMAKTASMMNSLLNPQEWAAKTAGLVGDVTHNEALQTARDYSNQHGISAVLQQFGEEADRYYDEKLSPAMKASMKKTILSSGKEEGFWGAGIKDPWKIGGMIAESIPSTIVSMGGGALITKGLIKTGFKSAPKIVQWGLGRLVKKYGIEKVAGVVGGAIGEGGYSGLDNANNAYEEMMSIPQEKLSKSSAYQEIFNSLPASLSDEKKHSYARKVLAMATAGFVGSITAVTTGIFGAPSGAIMGKLIGGKAGKSLWGNLIKGAIPEALSEAGEETAQSGIERLVQNTATKYLVDPTQELGEGVGEAMASGAVTGFAMGLGMGGAVAVAKKPVKDTSKAKDLLTEGADVKAEDILLGKEESERIRESTKGKKFKGPESIEAEEEAGEFSEEELEKLAKKQKEAPSVEKGGKQVQGRKPQREEPVKAPVKKQGPAAPLPGRMVQKPKADEGKPLAPESDRRKLERIGEAERREEVEREPPAWDKNFRTYYLNAKKMKESDFMRAAQGLYRKGTAGIEELAKRMGATIEADTNLDDVFKTVHARIQAGMQPRKKASEMTEEELREANSTDYLTGLRNKQAFELEDTRRAHVASIDLDSLKYINDAFGHQTGDAMLINFGNALKTITEADTYHVSGDEFIVQGDDPVQLDELLNKRVVDHLNKNPLTVVTPDGKKIKYEVQFSYGTAETVSTAEEALQKHKAAREAAGKRAGRGEIPPGLPGRPTEGKQAPDRGERVPEKKVKPGETPPDTDDQAVIDKELKKIDKHPTEAQKEAGNYKKGHFKFMGFSVTTEHAPGEYREGKDKSGKKWRQKMANAYGYFARTEGKDGDEIDLFLGDYPETPVIQIVHQVDPKTRKPDEDKVMLGFRTPEEAKTAYLANYEKGWRGFGSITQMLKPDFADWLDKQTKARAAKKKAKKLELPSPKPAIPGRHDNWRNNLIKARQAAIDLGITKTFGGDWSNLQQIVAHIDNYDRLQKKAEKEKPVLPTKPIKGVEGKKTKIITPGNRRGYNAYYTVVEADDLIPSHNAQTFQKNSDYPEGIQERTYHSDSQEQGKVITNAQQLNPSIVLSDDPTPTNGPPIATAAGIILGGNSRTMSIQRAYAADKPNQAVMYKHALWKDASKFGLTPKEVDARRRPVLVRTVYLEKDDVQTLHRMASDFNKTLTQGLSQEAEIASMGKNISVETIEKIGLRMANRDLTIRQLLGKKDGLEVLDWLIDDDAIAPGDKNKYINQKLGVLNEAGKIQIEKALFGSIIDDAELLDAAPKSLQNKLGRALPSLARIKARGDQWDITPQLKEALELATKAKSSDLSIREYLKQGSLFGDKKEFDDIARALAFHLETDTQTVFAKAFKTFAGAAMADTKGQAFLFAPRSFQEAFKEAFQAEVEEPIPAASPKTEIPAAAPKITDPVLMAPDEYITHLQDKFRADLEDSGIDYAETVEVEETGKKVKRDIDAVGYLNDIDEEIAAYESLLNCMAGRSK
jgi:diguanylate cyclase (GGDEF)-like protein